jgi:hypothetical protein
MAALSLAQKNQEQEAERKKAMESAAMGKLGGMSAPPAAQGNPMQGQMLGMAGDAVGKALGGGAGGAPASAPQAKPALDSALNSALGGEPDEDDKQDGGGQGYTKFL